jgi:Helix-turn-helix domain
MPELMTRKEVMDYLRVASKSTMINWERSGKLHPIKIGRHVLYTKESIMTLINGEE